MQICCLLEFWSLLLINKKNSMDYGSIITHIHTFLFFHFFYRQHGSIRHRSGPCHIRHPYLHGMSSVPLDSIHPVLSYPLLFVRMIFGCLMRIFGCLRRIFGCLMMIVLLCCLSSFQSCCSHY